MAFTLAVIGGANTDVFGFAHTPVRPGDSAPGFVRISPGGVGRNVAENLARLGCDVRLVTAVGEGIDADALVAECRHLGIDVRAVPSPGLPCPRYVCVIGADGVPVAGVSDMRATDRLLPEAVAQYRSAIDGAEAIVLDANLPEETIAWACTEWGDRPILLDAVSVAKATRAAGCLARLHTLKANLDEARAIVHLSGGGLEEVAAALLDGGVRRAVVTNGVEGGLLAEASACLRFKAVPAHPANATGAGDAFMAGLAYGTVAGLEPSELACFAAAMAAFALESERTVSERITLEAVLRRAQEQLS